MTGAKSVCTDDPLAGPTVPLAGVAAFGTPGATKNAAKPRAATSEIERPLRAAWEALVISSSECGVWVWLRYSANESLRDAPKWRPNVRVKSE